MICRGDHLELRRGRREHTSHRPRVPSVQRWRILLGYNLPFLLWSLSALQQAWTTVRLELPCPAHSLLGWCPACGLTRDYAALLRSEAPQPGMLYVVLAAFVLNSCWSLVKARRAPIPAVAR